VIRFAMFLFIYLPSLFFSQTFSVYDTQENTEELKFQHPELYSSFPQNYGVDIYKLDSLLIYNIFNEQSSKVLLNHDLSNNLISSLILNNSGNLWLNSSLFEYTYDLNGNLIFEEHYDWSNGKWNPFSKVQKEYTDNNRISLSTFMVRETGNWRNQSQKSYEYFDDQNLIKETTVIWIGNEWQNHTLALRYSKNVDYPDSIIFNSWVNDSWSKHRKTVYQMHNNVVTFDSIIVSAWNNGNWENYLVMEIVKDDYGRIVEELEKLWDDDQWINDIQRYYDYFEESNFIEYVSCRIWETDHWAKGYTPLIFNLSKDIRIGFISYKGVLFYSVFPTGLQNKKLKENSFVLHQNYPNPFNATTKIKYSIPQKTHLSIPTPAMPTVRQEGKERSERAVLIELTIYDILGRVVATLVNKKQKPGNYEVIWDTGNLPSGVYIYKLSAGGLHQTEKMILLR